MGLASGSTPCVCVCVCERERERERRRETVGLWSAESAKQTNFHGRRKLMEDGDRGGERKEVISQISS